MAKDCLSARRTQTLAPASESCMPKMYLTTLRWHGLVAKLTKSPSTSFHASFPICAGTSLRTTRRRLKCQSRGRESQGAAQGYIRVGVTVGAARREARATPSARGPRRRRRRRCCLTGSAVNVGRPSRQRRRGGRGGGGSRMRARRCLASLWRSFVPQEPLGIPTSYSARRRVPLGCLPKLRSLCRAASMSVDMRVHTMIIIRLIGFNYKPFAITKPRTPNRTPTTVSGATKMWPSTPLRSIRRSTMLPVV